MQNYEIFFTKTSIVRNILTIIKTYKIKNLDLKYTISIQIAEKLI